MDSLTQITLAYELALFLEAYQQAKKGSRKKRKLNSLIKHYIWQKCLGWGNYKPQDIPALTNEVQQYLVYYHHTRPHLGLNMQTPQEFKTSLLSHI